MDFDLILFLLGLTAIFGLIFYSIFYMSKSEKKAEKKLLDSLEEELITDPETGTKMTIEQAEKGHWIKQDNNKRVTPNSEIENLNSDDEKIAIEAINYISSSQLYEKVDLIDENEYLLTKTQILSKYDDWSYSHSYSFSKGIVLIVAPFLRGETRYEDNYNESQVMFWIHIDNMECHYYLREKTSTEKLLDLIKNDDDLKLKDYESFTIRPSSNFIKTNKLVQNFKDEKGLEIEINDNNLFIKTTRLVNRKDIKRIEQIIENIG